MATRNAVARRREGFETEVEIREHRLIVDETVDDGGKDQGPRPTELLAASLASCTTITLVMYADRKGWDVGAVEVGRRVRRRARRTRRRSSAPRSPIPAELSDEQRERLLVIAGKCPVHRTLAADDVELEDDLRPIEPRRLSLELGLAGRVCVVTGASRGSAARPRGCSAPRAPRVLLVARTERDVVEAADECVEAGKEAGGEAESLACDVTDADAAERILAAAEERFGPARRPRQQRRHRHAGATSTTSPKRTGTPPGS